MDVKLVSPEEQGTCSIPSIKTNQNPGKSDRLGRWTLWITVIKTYLRKSWVKLGSSPLRTGNEKLSDGIKEVSWIEIHFNKINRKFYRRKKSYIRRTIILEHKKVIEGHTSFHGPYIIHEVFIKNSSIYLLIYLL